MFKKENWQIMKLTKYVIFFAVLGAFLGQGETYAASSRGLISQGNKAYTAGDFATALQKYQQAAELSPDSAHVQFDLGNGLYKNGDFAGALTAYEKATALSDDSALVKNSKYNMGNAVFQEAEKMRQADPGNALQSYQQSADFYRAVLGDDAGFSEAARNLEVSKRRIAAVKQELQEQQKQQDKQQEQQEQQEDGDEQEDSDQQQQSQDPKKDDDKSDKSEEGGQDSASEDGKDESEPEKSSTEQEGDNSAQDKDSEAEQQEAKEQDGQQASAGEGEDADDTGMAISAEDLLNEEKENSLKRQQYRAGRYEEVDKDW